MRSSREYIVRSMLAIAVATFLVLVGVYTGKHFASNGEPLNVSDTTIVINHYYDTTIYQVKKVYQTVNKSYYYKDYDTNIVLDDSACDSVRVYEIKDTSDSIEIYGNAVVHGELINHSLEYRWLLPYSTEMIKTVYVHDRGFVGGINMLIGNGLTFGISSGWRTAKGIEYKAGYFTNGTVLFSFQKDINFGFRKTVKSKINSKTNN